ARDEYRRSSLGGLDLFEGPTELVLLHAGDLRHFRASTQLSGPTCIWRQSTPEGWDSRVADQSYPVGRDGELLPRIEPLQAKHCGGSRVPVLYVVSALDHVCISFLT